MISFVSDDEFLVAVYDQIKFNNQEEIDNYDKDLKEWRINYSKKESEKKNLLRAIKDGLKNIKSIEEELETIESELVILSNEIRTRESSRDLAANQKINKTELKKLLTDYVNIYEELSQEEKIRFNKLLFEEITSFFNKNEEDGKIVIKMRGDGKLEKSWNKIKNANKLTLVRTSDGLGSANTIHTQNIICLNYLFLLQNPQMASSN
jgi:chromosome segregation ATPase